MQLMIIIRSFRQSGRPSSFFLLWLFDSYILCRPIVLHKGFWLFLFHQGGGIDGQRDGWLILARLLIGRRLTGGGGKEQFDAAHSTFGLSLHFFHVFFLYINSKCNRWYRLSLSDGLMQTVIRNMAHMICGISH